MTSQHNIKTIQPSSNWTDEDWGSFRTSITSMLHAGDQLTVTFTKKDGTERVMHCTLSPAALPAKIKLNETKKPRRQLSDNSLAVFDIDANDWRSFVIRSVTKVEFSL